MSLIQPGCVNVVTRPQLRELIEQVRRRDRIPPVVALTSRPGEQQPAFSPNAVRAIVGSAAQLYFISTGHLTRTLAVKLGERLAVENGDARIWWSGASRHTATRHPLIPVPACENDAVAMEEFARKFKATRPLTPEYLDMLECERNDATRRDRELSVALAEQSNELNEARLLVEATRMMVADAEVQLRTLASSQRRGGSRGQRSRS